MSKALDILSTYFGHAQFRPVQEEIVSKVLQKENVLALLPTGGGKSICFQVPALAQEGICIVISPLIALMQDQVNNLKAKGIKAMALASGISYEDLDKQLDNCIYGNYKFLYLSPERLQQEIVLARIEQMPVNLIAIDEAHCVSQWGHDFRPSYLNIKVLKSIHPQTNWIALTATATEHVVKDIVRFLELENPSIIKKSFARKNIAFLVEKFEDKDYALHQQLVRTPGSSIVYVRSRRETIRLSQFLQQQKISAAAYHGGISSTEKKERLQEWLQNKTRVVVATNAFGMGIDKADVRTVFHYHLPESMESYFQEAGRAGRDGAPSKAIILFKNSDIDRVQEQFIQNLPDVKFVKNIYRKLQRYFSIAYGEGHETTHDFSFNEFCMRYALNSTKTYQTLQLLDRTSIVKLSKQFRKKIEVQFIISSNQVLHLWQNSKKYEALIKVLLRTYPGLFEQKTTINILLLQKKSGLSESLITQLLTDLHKEEIIELKMEKHDASITFLVPREDDHTINPIAKYIQQQYRLKKDQVSAILAFVTNEQVCKSVQLLSYFDEKNTEECGICSVCLQKKNKHQKTDRKKIGHAIIELLKKTDLSSREIVEQLNYPEKSVLHILQLLLENNRIQLTQKNTYVVA